MRLTSQVCQNEDGLVAHKKIFKNCLKVHYLVVKTQILKYFFKALDAHCLVLSLLEKSVINIVKDVVTHI